jgi:hypothetical protein
MDTVRIVIKGEQLTAPVEITDAPVVSLFRVGAGPGNFKVMPGGARLPNYPAQCFIVDWSKGIANPPEELQAYDVFFITTRTDRSTYTVRYGVDRATNDGYVYIPGKTDPGYRDNTWIILRGNEGNWFHAWSAWEGVANQLIAKALKTR